MNYKAIPVCLVTCLLTFKLIAGSDGLIKDVEGNIYKIVKIGNQTWMADNLKVTMYNDGTAIPMVKDAGIWINLKLPAYCWYENNEGRFRETYGALYNWYAVTTDKLCPTGWHVPTVEEWRELVDFAGSGPGGKLKESGFTHWRDPNNGAVDEYGFTALPGGLRNLNGDFDYLSYAGYWWSASEHSQENGWLRTMYFASSNATQNNYTKNLGLSVRCIKD